MGKDELNMKLDRRVVINPGIEFAAPFCAGLLASPLLPQVSMDLLLDSDTDLTKGIAQEARSRTPQRESS